MNKEEVNEFSERLKTFFTIFDGLFLYDENAEEILNAALEGIKERISRNTSAMVVITALGGEYNAGVDEAKAEELMALINLLQARKSVREETLREFNKEKSNSELLESLFGLKARDGA